MSSSATFSTARKALIRTRDPDPGDIVWDRSVVPVPLRACAMLERYTEKARRVLFLARYEATNAGAPAVETEHLLLAVTRENRELMQRLCVPESAIDSIRPELEAESPRPAQPASTGTVPLSNQSKRVLAYAAEEADRLNHHQIGTEHIFVGILREENSLAARLLNQRGVTLVAAQIEAAAQPAPSERQVRPVDLRERVPPKPAPQFEIHGHKWDADYLRPFIDDLRRFFWEKRVWMPPLVLIHRPSGRIAFHYGQAYDPKMFEAVTGIWALEHCELCRWELCQTADPEHGVGYTNGRSWLCTECAEKFVIPMKCAGGFSDYT